MKNNQTVSISPNQVPLNASLTVRATADDFPGSVYTITDELGRIIRKGVIGRGISEFRLSMVGLATGVYRFTMGPAQQRFTIL